MRNIRGQNIKRKNLFIFHPIKRQKRISNYKKKKKKITPLYASTTQAVPKPQLWKKKKHTLSTQSVNRGQSDLCGICSQYSG